MRGFCFRNKGLNINSVPEKAATNCFNSLKIYSIRKSLNDVIRRS